MYNYYTDLKRKEKLNEEKKELMILYDRNLKILKKINNLEEIQILLLKITKKLN